MKQQRITFQKAYRSLIGGNLHSDLQSCGICLEELSITIRQRPNRNKKMITGNAKIMGHPYGFGVNSYDELLNHLIDEVNLHYQWIHEQQKERRRLNRERWIAEHPGETFPWDKIYKFKDNNPKRFYLKK